MNNQIRSVESNDTHKLIHLMEDAKDILGKEGLAVSLWGGNPAQKMWISKLGTLNFALDFDYESAKSDTHYHQANERTQFELLYDGQDFVLAKSTGYLDPRSENYIFDPDPDSVTQNIQDITQWLEKSLNFFKEHAQTPQWHKDAIFFALQS